MRLPKDAASVEMHLLPHNEEDHKNCKKTEVFDSASSGITWQNTGVPQACEGLRGGRSGAFIEFCWFY